MLFEIVGLYNFKYKNHAIAGTTARCAVNFGTYRVYSGIARFSLGQQCIRIK